MCRWWRVFAQAYLPALRTSVPLNVTLEELGESFPLDIKIEIKKLWFYHQLLSMWTSPTTLRGGHGLSPSRCA